MSLRLRREIQAVLRRGDGELIALCGAIPPEISSTKKCDKLGVGAAVMKSRCGYKGYVIEVRLSELKDGGFSAEFSVEEHDGAGVTETQFYLPDTFPSQESAIEAAIQAGRQKIDAGFERGSVVVNG
jgi:hypothetical protein